MNDNIETDDRPNTLAAALAALNAGFCVIRADTDGSKKPVAVEGMGTLRPDGIHAAGWAKYRVERPTRDEVASWFADGHPGIGYVCGAVSGGLIMLELEGRAVAEGVEDGLRLAAADEGLEDLFTRATAYCEATPSGGRHFLFRVGDGPIPGNRKLARRSATEAELASNPSDSVKVLIETRGEGGFTVAAPSHGPVHATGRPWKLTRGSVDTIATITTEECRQLFQLCSKFDQLPRAAAPAPRPRVDKLPLKQFTEGQIGESWMDAVEVYLSSTVTMSSLLERYGYTFSHAANEHSYFIRPGKQGDGISASVNASDRMLMFSTSTPFAPYDGTVRPPTYSKLDVIAVYEHEGDRQGAARHIAEQTGILTAWQRERDALATRATMSISDAENLARPMETTYERQTLAGVDGHRYTDAGNAARLIEKHGPHIRFVPTWNTWIVWDGTRWQHDHADNKIRHLATNLGQSIISQENIYKIRLQADPQRRSDELRALIAWGKRSENRAGIEGTVKAAASAPGVAIGHEEIDAHPWLLNVRNGTFDLRAGVFRAHDPADLLMMQAGVAYEKDAIAPEFDRFIQRILPDVADRSFVQRTLGLALVGEQVEHLLPIALGSGANGKSTLTKIIASVFGSYAVVCNKDVLLALKYSGHPTAKATLFRRRLAHSGELPPSAELDEAQVKELTGGDRISARRMREDEWSFEPSHTLWLHANHRPRITGRDDGIWRRVKLIPFTVQIPESERDPHLAGRIIAEEGPGVLNWLLQGLADYLDIGLATPTSVSIATDTYRAESDTITAFVDESDLVFREALTITASELKQLHLDWFTANGVGDKEKDHYQRVVAELKRRGAVSGRSSSQRSWLGVGRGDDNG